MIYAQINEEGYCVAISNTDTKIKNDLMVPLEMYNETYLNRLYDMKKKRWMAKSFGDNYAQLDASEGQYKRVVLIGHDSIVPQIVNQYPNMFINLEGRTNIPLDTFDWYYNAETDTFMQTKDLPVPEPPPVAPSEPTSSEILQVVNDLRAELEISGVIA